MERERTGCYFTGRRHEELRRAVQEFAKHEVTPRISEMEAARRASVGSPV